MKAGLRIYTGLVVVAAAAVLTWHRFVLAPADLAPLVFLTVIAALLEVLPLELPNGTSFSLASAVYFVAFLHCGTSVALVVAGLAALIANVITGRSLYQVLFNTSQFIVSLQLAAAAFAWTGGVEGAPAFHQPLPVATFILVDFFANTGLLAVVYAQLWGQPLPKAWLALVADAYWGYFAVMTLGFLAAVLLEQSLLALVPLALVLVFLQRLFAAYFKLLRASRERERVLGTILNATDHGVLMVDAGGRVIHANQRAADYLGLTLNRLVGAPIHALPIPRPRAPEAPEPAELVIRQPVERVLRYHWAPIAESIEAAGAVITLTDITAEREATRKLEQYDASIRTLAAAVDARDRYTHGHSERVSAYAVALGRRLGLSHHEIEDLRYGALLHDVGKIGIDDRILRKRGPLTAEERAVIMEHPAKGAAILAQAGAFASILPIVLYHHEWYNGGGYPTGRSGEAIPLGARITAVVDAFDAMTSRRHYRAELGVEEAIARLLEGRGVQFDPAIVDAFVAGLRDGSIPVIGRRDPPAPDLPVAAGEEPGRILPVHRQELQLIYRIALETRLLLDLGRFLPRVLGILSEVLAPDHAYIAMTEAPDRPPRIVAATGPAGGEGDAVAEGELADWVIRTGQPVLWSQGLCECSHLRSRDAATACAVAVPLIVQGQVVGALCCEAADPCAYDEDSLYLLKAVAAQLASAIEIARYHEQVRDAALRDGLTGVFNHTYFYEEAERALSEARRQGTPFSLAILDVNDMKMVNDRHGHLAGDEVLRYYAGVLKRHTPEHCTLARYGGDEFVVIMPATPRPEAEAIVRRMVQAFDRSIRWNGLDIPLLGMAWGVASYPGDGGRVTELLNAADMAMYGRKRRGRVVPFRMTADD